MGELVILVPKPRRKPPVKLDDNISEILKEAVATSRESFGREEEKIFRMYGNFENLLRAKIGAVLLSQFHINVDLFRCSLYVSEMLAQSISKGFDSDYAIDYLTRGYEDCEPEFFKKGGDFCFALCTFFEGRCNRRRRPLKTANYLDMGARLYFTHHAETKDVIGYYMGENFREMVDVTKCAVQTL